MQNVDQLQHITVTQEYTHAT